MLAVLEPVGSRLRAPLEPPAVGRDSSDSMSRKGGILTTRTPKAAGPLGTCREPSRTRLGGDR
jgi:hypothetical protein